MRNLKSNEKSKGVLLFAFNTNIDYVTIADRTSRLIQHHLKLPITLVTDETADPKFAYDRVIRISPSDSNYRTDIDTQTVLEWRNFGRYLAYKLSPYYDTLLLDTDYIVLDNVLLKILGTTLDYRLIHHSYTDTGDIQEDMGTTSLPFVWATVVAFKKTKRAEMLFDLVGRIERNYEYYRALYNIRERNFRNDYAFAIANIILSGYDTNEEQGIPWKMYTIDKPVVQLEHDNEWIRVRYKDSATVVARQNIHIMDKQYLLSDNFEQVVEKICEST